MMRPEDAAVACALGADAIGMIFHPPSPRNISIERAMLIMEQVAPFVTPVGVFVDASASQIKETASALGLRIVQLSGHETPDDVAALRPLRVIKAIRVVRGGLREALQPWRGDGGGGGGGGDGAGNLIGLLMEPGTTNAPGGTGVANDWDEVIATQQAGALENLPPLIAAGGLTPQNVADVIRAIRPFAVDVSSGVEHERGVKSADKLEQFIRAARSCDHEP